MNVPKVTLQTRRWASRQLQLSSWVREWFIRINKQLTESYSIMPNRTCYSLLSSPIGNCNLKSLSQSPIFHGLISGIPTSSPYLPPSRPPSPQITALFPLINGSIPSQEQVPTLPSSRQVGLSGRGGCANEVSKGAQVDLNGNQGFDRNRDGVIFMAKKGRPGSSGLLKEILVYGRWSRDLAFGFGVNLKWATALGTFQFLRPISVTSGKRYQ